MFLYDLTNTYFEGGASKNTSAKCGHSKEKRSDCPLVTLALVVAYRGFPIFSQIYKGNQSEPETLEEILKRLYVEDETLFKETLKAINNHNLEGHKISFSGLLEKLHLLHRLICKHTSVRTSFMLFKV